MVKTTANQMTLEVAASNSMPDNTCNHVDDNSLHASHHVSHHASLWLKNNASKFTTTELNSLQKALVLASQYYQQHIFYPTNIDLLSHALACATKVADLNLYVDAVIATILFALPKYLKNYQDQLTCFTPKVLELIDGINRVTEIRKCNINSFIDEADKRAQIETIRKMLLAMASDIRVVLIVLVGRDELMRHLKSCPDVVLQKKIALETMEIFAPLANRLGVWQLKWELEDLSFKYLYRDQYNKIANLLDETRKERLLYIENIKNFLSEQIEQSGIKDYQVSGRAKHIYSIWRKMQKKNYGFDELYDIRALRVIVPEVRDCYTVLGIVHTRYSPIPGEFDDYISNPKANDYRSLHTCVIGPEDRAVEIQIRTFAMHDHAEYGIAAHWRYKEMGKDGSHESNHDFVNKVAWIRQILDWRDETDERKDVANLFKNEVFSDTIYALTPRGRVISLVNGSTPIDFAYAIHRDIGHKCRGAKVDGLIVPLSTVLKNGQRVEILTVKEGGPSVNWLHDGMVKSTKAISHIRKYIREQNQEQFYSPGVEILEREIAKIAIALRPTKSQVAVRLNYDNEKNLCVALGRGDISINELRHAIMQVSKKSSIRVSGNANSLGIANIDATNSTSDSIANRNTLQEDVLRRSNSQTPKGILVDGVSGIVTYTAKCCKPIPGDMVMGFVTKGKGVAIHRSNCLDLKRQAKLFPDRVVNIGWGHDFKNTKFIVDLEVTANDRHGLLRDLTDLFLVERLGIASLKTHTKGNVAIMCFTIQIVGGSFNFDWLANKLFAITGVIGVTRR